MWVFLRELVTRMTILMGHGNMACIGVKYVLFPIVDTRLIG